MSELLQGMKVIRGQKWVVFGRQCDVLHEGEWAMVSGVWTLSLRTTGAESVCHQQLPPSLRSASLQQQSNGLSSNNVNVSYKVKNKVWLIYWGHRTHLYSSDAIFIYFRFLEHCERGSLFRHIWGNVVQIHRMIRILWIKISIFRVAIFFRLLLR